MKIKIIIYNKFLQISYILSIYSYNKWIKLIIIIMKILIVEDNLVLSNNIATYLKLENIESKQLFIWWEVNYEITLNSYDLVILDLGLPDIDWVEVCKKIRDSGKNIPILILTARNTINDKIWWLQSWADDYLTKPFDYWELLVRIQVLLRRNFNIKSENIILNTLEWNEIDINISKKEVQLNDKEIHLSNTEIDLLIYLSQNKWNIITKETLLEKVWWEYDDFNQSRTVDVYVWYLRKKLWKSIVDTVRWQWYTIK
jgi:DNA-binding response OmpR family regulator